MPMPEATIHEDDSAILAHHNIGVSGKPRVVKPIAETAGKQELAHQQLRLGILAPNRRHAAMALFLSHLIHITHSNTFSLQKYTKNHFSEQLP